MELIRLVCWLVVSLAVTETVSAASGSTKRKTLQHTEVLKDALHYWTFDISGNLFWISDKKTGITSKSQGNGARLIQAGLVKGRNYFRIQGSGSRLLLGSFSDCSVDLKLCRKGLTIALWLRFRELEKKEQYFLGNMDIGTKVHGYALLRTTSKLMNISVSASPQQFYALYPTTEGTWQHHVITIHPNNDVNVYLNSVKAMRDRVRRYVATDTDARRRSTRDISKGPMLSLGRPGYDVNADYDEVAIWDRVLTDAEVKSLYKGGLTAPTVNKQCQSNASSICITWPSIYDPFDQIMKVFAFYKIYVIDQKEFSQKLVLKGQSSVCIGNLEPLAKYGIGLYLKLRNAESLISRMVICSTADGVPSAPEDVEGKGTTSSSILMKWKTPRPANGKILHYEVILRKPATMRLLAKYNVTALHMYESFKLNITNLRSSTPYVVEIRSVGKKGRSGKISLEVSTQSPIPTETVQGLKAVRVSWDSIKLNWSGIKDNGKSVYTYEIFYKEHTGKLRTVSTEKSSMTVTNLAQLSSYLFNIRAGTTAGFGPQLKKELYVRTADRNECLDNWANLCDINADCFNTEGSYLCQCKKGYFGNGITCRKLPADAKLDNFCPSDVYRNIVWPKTYKGDIAVKPCPRGTNGFATRQCLPGLRSKQAAFARADLSKCVSADIENIVQLIDNPNIPAKVVVDKMKNATDHKGAMYGGDIKTMVGLFGSVLDNKMNSSKMTKMEAEDITKTIAGVANNLLEETTMSGWKDIPVYPDDSRTKSASRLFDAMEGFAGVVSDTLGNIDMYKITFKNVEIMVQRVPIIGDNSIANYEKVTKKRNADHGSTEKVSSVSISLGSLKNKQGKSNLSVSFLSFNNAEDLLRPSRNQSHQHERKNSRIVVNSALISANVIGMKRPVFSEPVVLVLPHLEEKAQVLNTSCVFWSQSARGGDWLTDGCRVNFTNASHTVCHCNHLTNFAILMSVSNETPPAISPGHQLALRIITYMGLFISLLALFLALFAFTCFRFLKSARTIYHRHLIVALIFAHLLFLVGIERTEIKLACTLIAVFLHYFFLVAFVWMGMEGVLLYFMLTKIFNSRKLVKRKLFYIFCWVVPAFYVAVLASIFTPYYGTGQLCWLSAKDGFSWAFVGPVLFVISMNVGFMVRAFKVMAEKRKGPDDIAHEAWYWLKGCLVLTCVLGVTWIIGIFYVDSNTLVFAYVFNILNAFQGLFIFIFHCIIDARVRSEFLRILKCQTRSDYNEKAGYSSSMRFRYWSTTKSNGSLDRSTVSRGGHKRLNSDSLPDHNGKSEGNGRHPSLLKAVPEVEEERTKRTVPEKEPLLQAAPDVDFEGPCRDSRLDSSISDGEVFLDNIDVPTVEDNCFGPDIGRFSPIDPELARRISESSVTTLEEIVDILQGKSSSSEDNRASFQSSKRSENDTSEKDEDSITRLPYDQIQRSMEELVVSLEEEEERIDSEASSDSSRLGIIVEAEPCSTRSSLSVEMSLSDEEDEGENRCQLQAVDLNKSECVCGKDKCDCTEIIETVIGQESDHPCECDTTMPIGTPRNNDKDDGRLDLLESPLDDVSSVNDEDIPTQTDALDNTKAYPDDSRADKLSRPHDDTLPLNCDKMQHEDPQLVHLQVEQTPCYAKVTYPPAQGTQPKSRYDRALRRIASEPESPTMMNPRLITPYEME